MLKIESIILNKTAGFTNDELQEFLYSQNIDLLGLYKRASLYNKKGFKEFTKYYIDDEFQNKACYIEYEQKLEDGILVGRNKHFKFLSEEDEIEIEFTKYEPLESNARQKVLRSARIRAIDGMIDISKGTPLESYISALYAHYSQEIISYKDGGTSDLFNAIMSEDNGQILAILDAPVSEGVQVRDSILYSIT